MSQILKDNKPCICGHDGKTTISHLGGLKPMTKKEQIRQTIKDLAGMLEVDVYGKQAFVTPHDKIQITQSCMKFLKEYEATL